MHSAASRYTHTQRRKKLKLCLLPSSPFFFFVYSSSFFGRQACPSYICILSLSLSFPIFFRRDASIEIPFFLSPSLSLFLFFLIQGNVRKFSHGRKLWSGEFASGVGKWSERDYIHERERKGKERKDVEDFRRADFILHEFSLIRGEEEFYCSTKRS